MNYFRYTILNISFVFFLFLCWTQGWLTLILKADTYYLGTFIFGCFVLSNVLLGLNKKEDSIWVSSRLTLLGLIGTVIGLTIALVDISNKELFISGVWTAFLTTLVGAIGYLWMDLMERLCYGQGNEQTIV
jgi:hypothetical protein